ncbi:PE-PGRS family protein PE_PGRS26-like [Pithys albifrons albifrons]|uniref:PE-PGRS family protein PE_PGRS26-like n=1 Tax=Pithys albifrons albifrons TaxID=3385563 RepID=UPI003A5CDB10
MISNSGVAPSGGMILVPARGSARNSGTAPGSGGAAWKHLAAPSPAACDSGSGPTAESDSRVSHSGAEGSRGGTARRGGCVSSNGGAEGSNSGADGETRSPPCVSSPITSAASLVSALNCFKASYTAFQDLTKSLQSS